MDVNGLYTGIPHSQVINAVVKALENHKERSVSRSIVIKFLTSLLYLNNFVFNGMNYLQKKRCATRSSTSYKLTYLWIIWKYIYQRINDNSLCYLRFTDDIFMIWITSEKELRSFLSELNQVLPSIKFVNIFTNQLTSLIPPSSRTTVICFLQNFSSN